LFVVFKFVLIVGIDATGYKKFSSYEQISIHGGPEFDPYCDLVDIYIMEGSVVADIGVVYKQGVNDHLIILIPFIFLFVAGK
jgi:hypothetical protein